MSPPEPLLEIKNLRVSFRMPDSAAESAAVDGVDLCVDESSFTALVGQSGSGKSVTALSITRLVKAHRTSGNILYRFGDGFRGDLSLLTERQLESVRGREIGYVFQDPASSLNPVLKVGDQIGECCAVRFKANRAETGKRVAEVLALAQIRDVTRVARSFPHELSGGMKQRAAIAMALVSTPRLLVADEPTTALDATVESEILELLVSLRQKKNLSVLFITHNLPLAMRHAQRIYVMGKGRVVESLEKNGRGTFEPKEDETRRLFRAEIFNQTPKSYIEI